MLGKISVFRSLNIRRETWSRILKCPCDKENHFLFFFEILKVCLFNT